MDSLCYSLLLQFQAVVQAIFNIYEYSEIMNWTETVLFPHPLRTPWKRSRFQGNRITKCFAAKNFLSLHCILQKKPLVTMTSSHFDAMAECQSGRTICFHVLAERDNLAMLIQSVAHYNLVLGEDFFFFQLKIFGFFRGRNLSAWNFSTFI